MTLFGRSCGLVAMAAVLTGAAALGAGGPPEDGKAAPGATASSKPYDTEADAGQQIAAALKKAKRDQTRVLLQFGGNWCPKCLELHKLVNSDAELKKELRDEYEYVLIDYGQPPGKNVPLAKQYGADAGSGVPYWTVVDSSGRMFANQSMTEFETGAGPDGAVRYDTKAIMKFLKANQAKPAASQAVLDKGLEAAKRDGKRVFLHFGAPWCPWCHRLDDWMMRGDVAPVLGKDFVDVKIDTDRFPGGQAMLEKYTGGKTTGIPWFAFLDADGKVLAASTDKDGNNIGFPAEAKEVEHFKGMLGKAAKNMTAAEVEGLVGTLGQKKGEAPGGGH